MDDRMEDSDAILCQERETLVFPTLRFGEVTVARSRVLHFPKGLVGMPEARRFVFLHREEDAGGPFFWMQCVDQSELAFVVCEPQIFFPEYKVPLSRSEQDDLGIGDESEGLVCVILVVPEDPRHITANLRGPIVINVERSRGYQVVLTGEEYSVSEPLFRDPAEGGVACSS